MGDLTKGSSYDRVELNMFISLAGEVGTENGVASHEWGVKVDACKP